MNSRCDAGFESSDPTLRRLCGRFSTTKVFRHPVEIARQAVQQADTVLPMRYLPPRHPALAPVDPEKWPHQLYPVVWFACKGLDVNPDTVMAAIPNGEREHFMDDRDALGALAVQVAGG